MSSFTFTFRPPVTISKRIEELSDSESAVDSVSDVDLPGLYSTKEISDTFDDLQVPVKQVQPSTSATSPPSEPELVIIVNGASIRAIPKNADIISTAAPKPTTNFVPLKASVSSVTRSRVLTRHAKLKTAGKLYPTSLSTFLGKATRLARLSTAMFMAVQARVPEEIEHLMELALQRGERQRDAKQTEKKFEGQHRKEELEAMRLREELGRYLDGNYGVVVKEFGRAQEEGRKERREALRELKMLGFRREEMEEEEEEEGEEEEE